MFVFTLSNQLGTNKHDQDLTLVTLLKHCVSGVKYLDCNKSEMIFNPIFDVLFAGYRPCDPQIIQERMNTLDAAYEELRNLAADRRARLEESRKLWQFFWDMSDEEGWIREKEQLMSSPDLGHDLTSVHLLLNKHKVCTRISWAIFQPGGCLMVYRTDLLHLAIFLQQCTNNMPLVCLQSIILKIKMNYLLLSYSPYLFE